MRFNSKKFRVLIEPSCGAVDGLAGLKWSGVQEGRKEGREEGREEGRRRRRKKEEEGRRRRKRKRDDDGNSDLVPIGI